MRTRDVPGVKDYPDVINLIYPLMERVLAPERASWADLPRGSGIYIVFMPKGIHPQFQQTTGNAIYCNPTPIAVLEEKWKSINRKVKTDIVYIGKADDLKSRVRSLARFGAGKARNHKGGEWMWQISNLNQAKIRIITCPPGKQIPFEKWLLDTFYSQHGNWPLANREGGKGSITWHP